MLQLESTTHLWTTGLADEKLKVPRQDQNDRFRIIFYISVMSEQENVQNIMHRSERKVHAYVFHEPKGGGGTRASTYESRLLL